MTGQYFRHFLARTDEKTLFKMDHYLDVYDRELGPWLGKRVNFLEIGVYKGGSLRMWRDFFAPQSSLTFLDIDPACKALEIAGTDIRIGDTVYLQPKNGPRMAGTVIFSSPVHGCTTYTADAQNQDANVRFRFRLQDVHHVAPRHAMPALN